MDKNVFLLLLTVPMCITIELEDPGMFEAGNNMIEPRIVGGNFIDITVAPFMVSIQVLVPKRRHFCGGSIITPSVILTAAHCFYVVKAKEIWVNAGSTSWSGDGELIKIHRHVLHEDFNYHTGAHDVAVAILENELPINPLGYVGDKIRTLQLSHLNETPSGVNAYIAGWGAATCSGNTSTTNLKVLSVTVIVDEDCIKIHGSKHFRKGDNLCAGNVGIPTDEFWVGDSGGPLVYSNAQIGIASKTLCKFDTPNRVAIYASVIHHRSWIENKATELVRDKQLADNFEYYKKNNPFTQNPFFLPSLTDST